MLSPCVGICTYIDNRCIGCKRTTEEIEKWVDYTDEERAKIMERLNDEIDFD